MKPVGVLALQGGVAEHITMLESLDIPVLPIRKAGQISLLSALIIPGGESTTLTSLLKRWGIAQEIQKASLNGLPVFGTCAGAVLLSDTVEEKEHSIDQTSLGLVPVRAVRNYFGRQAASFEKSLAIDGLTVPFNGVFIRAPLLLPLSDDVIVLSKLDEGAVFLRWKNYWLASFHPELTSDTRIHKLFLEQAGFLPIGIGPHS